MTRRRGRRGGGGKGRKDNNNNNKNDNNNKPVKEKWDDDGNGVKWRDSRQRGGLLRPETRLPRENTRSNRATSDDAPRTEGAFLIELACISSLAGYYPRYLADRVTWRHNRSSSNVTRIFEQRTT